MATIAFDVLRGNFRHGRDGKKMCWQKNKQQHVGYWHASQTPPSLSWLVNKLLGYQRPRSILNLPPLDEAYLSFDERLARILKMTFTTSRTRG